MNTDGVTAPSLNKAHVVPTAKPQTESRGYLHLHRKLSKDAAGLPEMWDFCCHTKKNRVWRAEKLSSGKKNA